MPEIKIPYGKRYLRFSVPGNRLLGVLENRKAGRGNIKKLLTEALHNTLAGPGLARLAAGKKKILVVVPDTTRHAHLREILPQLLKIIDDRSRSIDIIVATGLHKKHGCSQLEELVGKQVAIKYKVMSHSQDRGALVSLGITGNGVPITLNKALLDHDLVMSIGLIEPHLYAGYSGGAKTVAIGLAGAGVINVTHGIGFLDDPLTKIGSIGNNPFQDTLWEIAAKVPSFRFSVNIVNDADGSPLKIFAGETKAVFESGVAFAKGLFEVEAKAPADIVICGVGYPKDVNLYQASRAINYIVNVDRPILKKGGVLIVASQLAEGPGTSAAEELFYRRLKGMRSPEAFVSKVKKEGCVAGEHRAYMVARPLIDYNIIFVTRPRGEFKKDLPFGFSASIGEALKRADTMVAQAAKIYVVPRALATIAKLR